jgi:hypothetical protein
VLKTLAHTNCEHQSVGLLQTPPRVQKLGSRNKTRPHGRTRSPKKRSPIRVRVMLRSLRADRLIICQRVSGDELNKINALHTASARVGRPG